MAAVDLGDGNSMELGENPSPELLARVKTVIETNKAKASSGSGIWEQAKSLGSDLLRGAGRSLAGLAEGAAAFNSTERPSFKKSEIGQTVVGPSGDTPPVLTEAINKALPVPPGAGTARQYVRAGLEGLGGGVATGGVSPTVMASGLVGGLGGEAGHRLAGEPGKLLGTLAGGIVGGGAVAAANMVRPQTAAVAKEAMEGFTEANLRDAQAFKNSMAAQGTDIDLAQALRKVTGRDGNLTSIRDLLANRSQGNDVQKLLHNQPAALQREGEMMAAGLPGQNFGQLQSANNLQETASKAIQAATKARSDEVRGLYAKVGYVPPEGVKELIKVIQQDAARPGASEVLRGKAAEAIGKLSGQTDDLTAAVTSAKDAVAKATTASGRATAQTALAKANSELAAAGTKPIHALDIDRVISELRGPWKSGPPLKQAYPYEAGEIKGLAGKLNKRFQELSPEVAAAERRFADITEQTINPLKQGPVGRLNQASGYDPATQAMVSKFDGLMHTGTPPGSKVSEIRTMVKELGKVDPTAAEDALKNWVSRAIGKSADTPTMPGEPSTNLDMAKRINEALFKDNSRWQGIKDATAEMAALRGQKPEEVIRGLENYRQLISATISQPAKMGGLSAQDLKQLGGSSNFANAVRVFSFLPANRLGEAIERNVLGKTFSEFDAILTSREGADRLIKLGKVPIVSTGAKIMFGTLGAGLGNPSGLSQNNPPE